MTKNVVTIEGVEYDFKPLKVKQAISIAQKVAIITSKPELALDDDTYTVAKKICSGLLADGFEVDFDEYFQGKFILLGKVVIEGAKISFPDLMGALGKTEADSKLSETMAALGLAEKS